MSFLNLEIDFVMRQGSIESSVYNDKMATLGPYCYKYDLCYGGLCDGGGEGCMWWCLVY